MHGPRGDRARIQVRSRNIKMRPRWFNLDWTLSFFASLDDQIARISRMKASIFFVIRARSGPRFAPGNSAKERDDQASEGIIIVTRLTPRTDWTTTPAHPQPQERSARSTARARDICESLAKSCPAAV
jgi:hypothetical protein